MAKYISNDAYSMCGRWGSWCALETIYRVVQDFYTLYVTRLRTHIIVKHIIK